jgi:RimJ/RimL family protein N-acetyltransferase
MSYPFNLQPVLTGELLELRPLRPEDFNELYAVASDPLIWEQHPNTNRFKREVFEIFFEGALESGGAFVIFDKKTEKPIGSSRYYGYDKDGGVISIGYTFLAKDHWGTTYNRAVKDLMLDHAFKFVNTVLFHIGTENIRSQKAIEKLGAVKCGEHDLRYYGEEVNKNFIFEMEKQYWEEIRNSS